MTSTAAKARASGSRFARVRHWFGRFESPTTTYYLLLATTAILVVFGLIMVLSASAITSLTQSKSGSAFTIFRSQLLYAGIGTVGLLIASRIAVPLWKKLALPILGGALVLQLLVAFIGTTVNGNRNWLRFGPVSIQPSELVKFGLVLFGALALTAKRDKLGQIGHVVVPYLVPGAAIALALVLLGGDLGTSIILAAIIAATLWAAGVPLRWFLASALVFGVIASAFVISSPNRLGRFDVWLGRDTDMFGAARQPMQGRFALADGGWFGLGLGASRENGSGCPSRTTTSSSPSSVRNSACREPCSSCCSSACSPTPATAWCSAQGTCSSASPPREPWRGSSLRRWSTSGPSSACSRSSGCRCRWCPRAVPP